MVLGKLIVMRSKEAPALASLTQTHRDSGCYRGSWSAAELHSVFLVTNDKPDGKKQKGKGTEVW